MPTVPKVRNPMQVDFMFTSVKTPNEEHFWTVYGAKLPKYAESLSGLKRAARNRAMTNLELDAGKWKVSVTFGAAPTIPGPEFTIRLPAA